MSPARVMVVGAGGQLGSVVVRAFGGLVAAAYTRAGLDITSRDAVGRAIDDAAPDAVVNCAAFNDVDAAEAQPEAALAVNALAVRTLAREAARAGARLVHYSTDFVFDGQADEPYDEAASPSPRSVYGASKLLGEWFALEAPGALVLRVESLFGTPRGWAGRRGSMDGILARIEAGGEVPVFRDRVVSPSYMADVAAATRHLLASGAPGGVYHCVNSGHATWQEVAEEMARQLLISPRLRPITMDEVPLRAARPRFCALSNAKLARTGFPMPSWQDALRRWLAARAAAASAEAGRIE